ncbi:phosphoglycerate mutase-like protein [Pholiota conissans]|uniref:Phosphoglycerate mutase-like protein n=1 Tax=Pholiota conissans TaxID=109636 RepID=A0A9P5Z5U1_9AGAR|nr:phosphoglycerate mutase-like protein [Pholiota conissans]
MITVTFIRHGESEDNLRAVWAGWKDAPLSELGQKQANALGHYLSTTRITHIYASPLNRAHTTAKFVHHHQLHPKPSFSVDPNLREQHFGIAEGHPWVPVSPLPDDTPVEELWSKNIFPMLYERSERFPEGETLEDLAARAEIAIQSCVLPHLQAKDVEGDGVHVAVASHGLAIGELVAALLRLDPEADHNQAHDGLQNTAWTRVKVGVRGDHDGAIDPAKPPPLEVKVQHVNQTEHLKELTDLPRLHEGLDGAHAEALAFFGGDRTRAGHH